MSKPKLRELEVTLAEPILVSTKGNQVECSTVLLKSPTAKHRRAAFNLKQMFMRAMASQQKQASAEQIANAKAKKAASGEDELPTGSEIVMLLMASDENFDLFNDCFRDLVCNGCAEINGEPLNAHLYDKLDLEDAEKLLEEYLEHFLMKSLLQ